MKKIGEVKNWLEFLKAGDEVISSKIKCIDQPLQSKSSLIYTSDTIPLISIGIEQSLGKSQPRLPGL